MTTYLVIDAASRAPMIAKPLRTPGGAIRCLARFCLAHGDRDFLVIDDGGHPVPRSRLELRDDEKKLGLAPVRRPRFFVLTWDGKVANGWVRIGEYRTKVGAERACARLRNNGTPAVWEPSERAS